MHAEPQNPHIVMTSIRTLKIRRSTVDEIQPEMINDLVLGKTPLNRGSSSVRSAPAAASTQIIPMEFPYDRQCIIRFPAEIATKIQSILGNPATTDLTEILKITVDPDYVNGHPFRSYSLSIYDNQRELSQYAMKGVLVDLPTFVESYKTINNGESITKSADISQMLICFKASEFVVPYNAEIQRALNLLYPSGLTPPTDKIRYRKFRAPPSKEDNQNLRSAEDVIDSVMSGGALEWVVETEVNEEEAVSRAINEPDNVWTPTEEILVQLRQAGYIDQHGDIIGEQEDMMQY